MWQIITALFWMWMGICVWNIIKTSMNVSEADRKLVQKALSLNELDNDQYWIL